VEAVVAPASATRFQARFTLGIGVTPDLEDSMVQGRRIHVPRAGHLRPNRGFLVERYALFRRAS
jgi:hypothetical protein